MKIELDERSRKYLVQILEKRSYEITDLKELAMVNEVLKILGQESRTWLESYLTESDNETK
ncbi:hypothetical protein DW974_08330 [Lachnospiraceae bacterium AM48-27BH]|nr:hypothetical protein DW974_08330 [Lachnospiraceae bacterium AM48-27BH]DAV89419.1 MAG TPA: hypothetical protein [Bacteriophage sp.]